MQEMTLKISYGKIFSRLFDIATVIIGSVVICLIITHFNVHYYAEIFLLLFIMVAPSIFLFFEYLIITHKQQAIFITEEYIKIFYRNGTTDQLNCSDIEIIKLYMAAGNDKGNFTLNINENYYYAKIIGKDKTFVLTSLLGPDLRDALTTLKGIPIDRTRTGYAFIFFRKF